MKPKAIIRNYKGSDAFMTQSARVTYDLFVLGMTQFTTFDSTLNAIYAAGYLINIEKAETIVRDSVILGRQMTTSENVYSILDLGRSKYMEIKYFVQKTFPDSFGTQEEFGFEDYPKARRNQVMMGELLLEMHGVCEKYKIPLLAAGYNQPAIDAILPLREDLIQKNTTQKMTQKLRPKLTEDRINLLNNCYSDMMSIMAAAQLVYAGDYAKQHQFVYRTGGKDDTDYS